jgi:predicted transcriptional regulator
LKDSPKTIAEINKFLNLNSVAVLPQLKKLRENFLILKEGSIYSLSPLGIATVGRMQPMIDLLNVFGSQYDYWTNHAIECIPAPLLERIEELSCCTLSEPPNRTHLFEPHKRLAEKSCKIKKNKWYLFYF